VSIGGGREKKSFSLKIGEKRKEEKVFCGSEASNSLLPSAVLGYISQRVKCQQACCFLIPMLDVCE
jgi:hypothetical protein